MSQLILAAPPIDRSDSLLIKFGNSYGAIDLSVIQYYRHFQGFLARIDVDRSENQYQLVASYYHLGYSEFKQKHRWRSLSERESQLKWKK